MDGPTTGTSTFLFTDIEGSTKLWERNSSAMQAALARHDEILKATVEEHGGRVFKMVGDACYATFADAPAPWRRHSRASGRSSPNRGTRSARSGCAWPSTWPSRG
jgi:class 3 adenylate cyclase